MERPCLYEEYGEVPSFLNGVEFVCFGLKVGLPLGSLAVFRGGSGLGWECGSPAPFMLCRLV